MKKVLLSLLLTNLYYTIAAQSFNFQDYFPLKPNTERVYTASRLQVHSKPLPYPDAHIWCLAANIKGTDVFYFDDSTKNEGNRIIGSNIFLDGVCYYAEGKLFWSPIFWTDELKEANLDYFESLFPAIVKTDTVYKAQDCEKKVTYRFHGLEDQQCNGVLMKDCLKMTMTDDWKTAHYVDTVWLKKDVGVVRWMRSTGRLEEIKF